MKIQATKMLCHSNKRYASQEKKSVSDVDRCRLTARNVLAISFEIINDDLFKLSIENGPLDRFCNKTTRKKIPLQTASNLSSKACVNVFNYFKVTVNVSAIAYNVYL